MSRCIVLIGFQDQGNLGIGYLAAVLLRRGYQVDILDFRQPPETILTAIRVSDPLIVGFSLIFQYYLPQLVTLVDYLRARDVACHFCVGGHFPSLRHEAVLTEAAAIDCVVRFEGEETLIELADCLMVGRDWRNVAGIAYRRGGVIIANPERPLLEDLDTLPHPHRPLAPERILGQRVDPILGSRGCARTCSFCSIRAFYDVPAGRIVRRRRAAAVVAEMVEMHETRGTTVFLFQDDDFPLIGPAGRRWVAAFLAALRASPIAGRVIWKISCRVDEIERDLFADMKAAGLYMVYLGIESGNEEGLRQLNKGVRVADNLAAVATLKKLGLLTQYGFMLFDPSSTFASVRENVDFLRRIVGDGSAASVFCRMLPYGGTPIEAQLIAEGRLIGDTASPDYRFLDPRLDRFFEAVSEATLAWGGGEAPLAFQLNAAWNEIAILERLFPPLAGFEAYREGMRAISQEANALLLDTIDASAERATAGRALGLDRDAFTRACADLSRRLIEARNAFILRHQAALLAAVAGDVPVTAAALPA